jgi:cytochrome c peroxidase
MELFFSERTKCSTCHSGSNFSAPDGQFDEYGGGGISFSGSGVSKDLRGTTNIGLDLLVKDAGRENGTFKIPSLRNIALTAPYMHDGRFKSLDDVLNHYSSGIKANPSLDKKFKDINGRPKGLNLSSVEKEALIAFLNTLTDTKFISDPKYSDPFK